ncbi:MAG TPA: efflux RND transporter periplasmic adaptor subunit [Casimicrobiaceae bacterium]|nr:efflux RND transporter periplasmic adaptor subunit [Casimicrobiaceae bacterium]
MTLRSLVTASGVRCACALALAASFVVLAGCGKRDGADGAQAAPAPSPPLTVAVKRAELARVPFVIEAVGQAEGSREVEVRPRVSGILEKRLYNEGASVAAGQTLFRIDRAPFELAVAQAKAALAQERARQEFAQHEAERLKSLVDTKAISRREYDQAASTVKESAAAIQGAQAKLAEAELNLSYTNLKAPIRGVTSRAVRSEGSLVTANTDLLTTITQVDPLWVRFSMAEGDYERIRDAADSTQVSIVDNNGAIAATDGRLNFTGSTVDPKIGTIQLRAQFANENLKWLPGQFVKLRIQAGARDAYLVPQAAVTQTERARSVWIVGADGKAAQRTVQTSNWLGNDWIVTAGLDPGDLVIVDNLMKLKPGMAVQPSVDAPSKQASATPAANGTSAAGKAR